MIALGDLELSRPKTLSEIQWLRIACDSRSTYVAVSKQTCDVLGERSSLLDRPVLRALNSKALPARRIASVLA
jgi:hypothetical protein